MRYGRTVSRAEPGDLELGHARSAWHRAAASALGAIVVALLAGCDGSASRSSGRRTVAFGALSGAFSSSRSAHRGYPGSDPRPLVDLDRTGRALPRAHQSLQRHLRRGARGHPRTDQDRCPNAGQLNALQTLNLRPTARAHWGFDERKARSMTDAADDDPDDARCARGSGRAGPQVRRNGRARRAAARCRDCRQRPVRHVRHAQHVGCRRALRERPPAG